MTETSAGPGAQDVTFQCPGCEKLLKGHEARDLKRDKWGLWTFECPHCAKRVQHSMTSTRRIGSYVGLGLCVLLAVGAVSAIGEQEDNKAMGFIFIAFVVGAVYFGSALLKDRVARKKPTPET